MANENHGSPAEEASLMSHSPGTSNQNQPSSPKPMRLVQDLPDELVQAGWEKCWSKRENRPYYFNRFTNQSLWEMPVLGQHDVISSATGQDSGGSCGEKLELVNRVINPSSAFPVTGEHSRQLQCALVRAWQSRVITVSGSTLHRVPGGGSASPDSRKVVKWNVEDTFSWLRRDHSASKEDYMDRLEHLRKQCGPHVSAAAKDSVEGICSKIYYISLEYVKRIREKHLAILKENNISAEVEAPEVQDRLVYCYPVRLAIPSPPLPSVEMHMENNVACVRYKGEMVKVSRNYFSKLWLLYRYSCIDDSGFEKFLPRVWCLLRRYQMMFGVGLYEGTGLQGALPVHVFEALHKLFGVSFESPAVFPCREEMYYKAVHNTAVLFLQNSAGFAKWEPTPERLQELVAAYKHSGRTLSSSSSSSSSSASSTDKERELGREQSSSRETNAN
uniref:PDX1 C-terminal inhibiting factor 1 n=1 Tax=Pavo cristatus TaxID=9049 RepID=A0A8C9EK14_PAVCR